MQYNKWYSNYGSTVAEIDATILRKQRFAAAMAMKAQGPRTPPRQTSLAQEADLWKIREQRRASR